MTGKQNDSVLSFPTEIVRSTSLWHSASIIIKISFSGYKGRKRSYAMSLLVPTGRLTQVAKEQLGHTNRHILSNGYQNEGNVRKEPST